jgi:hypothetical protein
MTDRFPTSVYEAFAAQAGVSVGHARRVINGTSGTSREGAAEITAFLRAQRATAEVEVLTELDEGDIEDSAATPDPVADLKETVDRRTQRVLIARIAANTRWSREDPLDPDGHLARTADRRPHSNAYWLRKVDPDGVLSEAERTRRADCAKRAHFQRLALASAKARQARKTTRRD